MNPGQISQINTPTAPVHTNAAQANQERERVQDVANVIFTTLRAVGNAVLFIPLRIMQGINYIARAVTQLFMQIFAPPATAPAHVPAPELTELEAINVEMKQACQQNRYLHVWRSLNNLANDEIDIETVREMQAMIARLASLPSPVTFKALNDRVAAIVQERNL